MSRPSKAGRIASRSERSARTVVTPGTSLRFRAVRRARGSRRLRTAVLDERAVGLFTLPAGDGRAGTGEHHALATGEPGRFEHVAGANDVGVAQLFPRKAVAGPRCEVDDSVPAFESGPNRVEIGEIRTHRGDAGHVAPVQGGEARARFDDKAAHASNQNVLAHGPLSLSKAGVGCYRLCGTRLWCRAGAHPAGPLTASQ